MSLEHILTDHAYCEQKAATSCISLIQSYPEKEKLVEEVAPVVTEEWGHFRMVLREIKKRNFNLGHQRKDEYVNALLNFQIKGLGKERALLEKLLTNALIEARSCERFRLLSLHLEDDYLREFYHQFMVSEAGHYKMFLGLAKLYFDNDLVVTRWQEYLAYEADILADMTVDGTRMH